jgi:hypothetical protein
MTKLGKIIDVSVLTVGLALLVAGCQLESKDKNSYAADILFPIGIITTIGATYSFTGRHGDYEHHDH